MLTDMSGAHLERVEYRASSMEEFDRLHQLLLARFPLHNHVNRTPESSADGTLTGERVEWVEVETDDGRVDQTQCVLRTPHGMIDLKRGDKHGERSRPL